MAWMRKLLFQPATSFTLLDNTNIWCNIQMKICPLMCIKSGREGTLNCLLHQSPKFYNNIFLLVSSKTVGTFVNFDWLVQLVECPCNRCNLEMYITGGVILCIIILGMYINLSAIVLSLKIPEKNSNVCVCKCFSFVVSNQSVFVLPRRNHS